PMSVDFSRGAPRYEPENAAVARLASGTVDAVLLVGNTSAIPSALRDAFGGVRIVVIGPRASESTLPARIRIDTGVAGIHESGMALRLDDIPLPVRAVLPTPRDTASLLEALGAAIAAQTGAA
ncbi:MAG: hypothetical protein ACREMU_10255, partial [Gemmatimonadaceae bacterium]